MATSSGKETHIERTADEPRDSSLHTVYITRIDEVNPSIRLFRLGSKDNAPIKFLPGQWLDTFVPGIPKPGGFTITSPPSRALSPTPYLELAIQKSPDNPPAAWLWQPEAQIKGSEIQVRIGGSFVWPPPLNLASIKRVVLIAGGVGINPLMSIVSHLADQGCNYDVRFFYSTKALEDLDSEKILFLERLAAIFGRERVAGQLHLFFTGRDAEKTEPEKNRVVSCNESDFAFEPRRIMLSDIEALFGTPEDRAGTLVYVCGVPSMTDWFVSELVDSKKLAVPKQNVLYEKWW